MVYVIIAAAVCIFTAMCFSAIQLSDGLQKPVTRAATLIVKHHGPKKWDVTATEYCFTFQFADGARQIFPVSSRQYATFVEGDDGDLVTTGEVFCDFRIRKVPIASGPRLMAFLFTDLVDSTGMKQRLGDATFVQFVLQPHNQLFRELLKRFSSAVERDNAGDGFFATFESLSEAVEFALLFQRRMDALDWQKERPTTRIGIHLGDGMKFQEGDGQQRSAGQAQDLAARLMGLACGGQILLSRAVSDGARQYVRKHPILEPAMESPVELAWLEHGAYQLKGRSEPIDVFEVGAVGVAPLRAPADSEKAWSVVKAPPA